MRYNPAKKLKSEWMNSRGSMPRLTKISMKKLPRPDPRADTKEYRDYWLPMFERVAKEPIVWALQSSSLVKAARLLRPEIDASFASVRTRNANDSVHAGHDLAPVFMMLMAFAIENLLKGILVRRQPHRVTTVQLTKWEGGGHNLVELAKAAKVTLTRNEIRLLLTLSIHGEWAGRYPCPLNHDERLPRPTDGGGFAPLDVIADSDLDLVLALCGRFEQILDAECTRILIDRKRRKKNSPQG